MESTDDIKKYFNSKEYATAIIGTSTEESGAAPINESKISTLISLLTDPSNKEVKEEALIALKKENGGELLLAAIASPKSDGKKHILVAACWESEINYSKYLPFFIVLALLDDYLISMEAMTTIQNMEGPFKKENLEDGIKKIRAKQKEINSERAVLLNDLIVTLEDFLAK
jgi:hypothetical protein